MKGRKRNRISEGDTGRLSRRFFVPFALLVFLLTAACGSDPTALDEDELPQALFGTWSWIRATGGIAGTTRTPQSEGYTQTLTFTPPNQVEMSRDGVPEVITTFEFVPRMDNGSAVRSAELLYAQPLTGFDGQWVEISEGGDLVLSDPCCDGFVYEWRKEP